jgi:general secretion pathway protein A
MYEAFYGLREKPFNLTPDPRFLYLSTKHKEAFAHLLYGIKNLCGFVLLSGEIGTGKTTICRTLLNQLDDDIEVAFTFNPSLAGEEMLRSINQDFGIETKAETVKGLIDELNAHLLERTAAGKNCVLVMDEAQTLSPEVLEQIRLLSNLETETRKLLQIVLIGQPELMEKLALDQLRQLDQRITARYHLEPLDAQETLQYIAYRLRVAGGRNKVQFTKAAVKAIYRASGGTPRVINALCDRALLIGYTQEIRDIDRDLVEQAASEIRGPAPVSKKSPFSLGQFLPNPTVVVSVILLLLGMKYLIDRSASNNMQILEAIDRSRQQTGERAPGTTAPEPVEATPADQTASVEPTPSEPTPVETPEPPEVPPETVEVADAPPPEDRVIEQAVSPEPAADTPKDGTTAAASAILSAWGITPPGVLPEGHTGEAILACAAANGLSAEHLSPTIRQLEAINLPAFVLMIGNQRKEWSSLVGIEGDLLRLATPAGDAALMAKSEFAERYLGEAIIPWQDPSPGADILGLDMRGDAVRTLQVQLVALGLSQAKLDGVFGSETDKAVRTLQLRAGLGADGRVGRQTRMVMTSWLPGFATPALQDLQMATPEQLAQLRERLQDEGTPEAAKAEEPAAAADAPQPEPDAPKTEAPAATADTPRELPAVEAPQPEPEAPKAEESAAATDTVEKDAESQPETKPAEQDEAALESKVVPTPETASADGKTSAAPQPEEGTKGKAQGDVIVLEELPALEQGAEPAPKPSAAEGEKDSSGGSGDTASPAPAKAEGDTAQKREEAAPVTAPATPTFPLVPHEPEQDQASDGGPAQ